MREWSHVHPGGLCGTNLFLRGNVVVLHQRHLQLWLLRRRKLWILRRLRERFRGERRLGVQLGSFG